MAIILPVVFFSEIGDGLNCVCGGEAFDYVVNALDHTSKPQAFLQELICLPSRLA